MEDQEIPESSTEFEPDPQPTWSADLPVGQDISTRQAAAILGISERTVRRAVIGGELTASKDETGYHIDRDSLLSFAARMPRAPG